ncbi:MAG: hypothetical protein KIT11_06570 [Fimbriimonadaceae bacterium]|nr:hypothetical protein [Fimbriimonadaceae bacterium]QYK56019.1 MAG: hypothetical protein KF733_00760 [Fimbriimonadaceae bacterium]
MSPRLAFAIETAIAAGRATLPWFQTGVDAEAKGDGSPVTAADRRAEAVVRERIGRHFPGEAVLGEEEGGDPTAPDRWVVDPIDGTKSFVSGVPLFATLLSYEVDSVPIVGVAYFPGLDELYYAEKGEGAFWNGRICRVASEEGRDTAVVCHGGIKAMRGAGRLEGLIRLSDQVMATRGWSDAYGHALVASGRAVAMLDPAVKRWDVSAMALIVREAGGVWTDFAGREVLGDEAVSSTPWFHPTVMEAYSAVGAEPL